MGAGILECDVTFTKDRQLVCRHSQCDLHTTTNILAIPELAAKCTQPFTPADPATGTPASAQCCTSDITLAEFKTLCGKMDASNPAATTAERVPGRHAHFRTDLYATCGTLLTHAESIELFNELGAKFTPELKAPERDDALPGRLHAGSVRAADDRRVQGGARQPAQRVRRSRSTCADVLYWLANEPAFGKQAVFLDDRVDDRRLDSRPAAGRRHAELAAQGVKIIAPPMWALVTLDATARSCPRSTPTPRKAAGLDIITWTLERSGPLGRRRRLLLPVGHRRDQQRRRHASRCWTCWRSEVGVLGIFSDWPATVTYYANCMGLE